MAFILRDLPYFDRETVLTINSQQVIIRPHQIIVWISLTQPGISPDEYNPQTPRFPAILDTGLSYHFAIQEEHLRPWSGSDPEHYERLKKIRLNSVEVPTFKASVWLHLNRQGSRDEFAAKIPHRLPASSIAVYEPGTADFLRVPILGLRAFDRSRMRLSIDFKNHAVSLRV